METDGLATLAEVFIGLAGFSGISLVLRSNPSEYFLFRVLLIVGLSFIGIVVAVIPNPLIEAGIAETAVWRAGSGILVVTYLVVLPLLLSYRRKARILSEEMANRMNSSLMVYTGILFCSQFANTVGLVTEYAFSVMFFGLIGLFVYCGILFIISLTIGRSNQN